MASKPIVTPTATIIADSNPIRTITDKRGRQISWRRMSVLDQARMMRAVGSENSANSAFCTIAMVAQMVTEIDGIPNPPARNLMQIDAAIDRLGDDGYMAVSDDLVEMVGDSNVQDDAKN